VRRAGVRVIFVLLACIAIAPVARGADIEAVRSQWLDLLALEPHVLAPQRTRTAENKLEALESKLRRDPKAAVGPALADCERAIARADSTVRQARTAFAPVLSVRSAARPAAQTMQKQWRDAEGLLIGAARKLEVGRTEAAQRQAAEAQAAFEALRFAAVRGDVLAEVHGNMQRLDRADARHWVPRSYVRALDAVEAAEKLLKERGQADADVQKAAARAAAEVRHAQYLLDRIQAACESGDPARLESTVLEWEASLQRTLTTLDMPVDLSQGLEPGLEALEVRATTVVRERDAERAYSGGRQAAADSLRGLVAALADTVRVRDLELVELRRLRTAHTRITTLQSTFARDEGVVLQDGPDVVLRMHGLSFAPGETTLGPQAEPLLDKIVTAVAAFPGARIVVEGHTDSQGASAANMSLSEKRAETVRGVLLERAGLVPAQVTAVGRGSTRPVAAEDSEGGRALNRRIEIVIAPLD
jgi:outer membrane protein OmpA-like peptidoglycan-associated protein